MIPRHHLGRQSAVGQIKIVGDGGQYLWVFAQPENDEVKDACVRIMECIGYLQTPNHLRLRSGEMRNQVLQFWFLRSHELHLPWSIPILDCSMHKAFIINAVKDIA